MTQHYTVNSLCEKMTISRSLFYKLRSQGRGPDLIKIGNRSVITQGAADMWVQALEIEAKNTKY